LLDKEITAAADKHQRDQDQPRMSSHPTEHGRGAPGCVLVVRAARLPARASDGDTPRQPFGPVEHRFLTVLDRSPANMARKYRRTMRLHTRHPLLQSEYRGLVAPPFALSPPSFSRRQDHLMVNSARTATGAARWLILLGGVGTWMLSPLFIPTAKAGSAT